jgi:hypothetical protein
MKTAVELLVSKLFDSEVPLDEHIYNEIEQAKEMEKEYIKKGWLQDRDITFGDWQQEFEQWYSQEFKQQEQ